MAKRVQGEEIVAEYVEYAVVYDLDDETFTTAPTDFYDEARLMRAALGGWVVTRKVYETSWADAPEAT